MIHYYSQAASNNDRRISSFSLSDYCFYYFYLINAFNRLSFNELRIRKYIASIIQVNIWRDLEVKNIYQYKYLI